MRWGRLWSKMRNEKGFFGDSRWGAEWADYPYAKGNRMEVRLLRRRIVPCDSCKRIATCAMYKSLTRHRLRAGEYNQGTNVLHMCDIYVPANMPGDIRQRMIDNRSRGGEPT